MQNLLGHFGKAHSNRRTMETTAKSKGRKNLYSVVLVLGSVVLGVEEGKVSVELSAVPEKVNAAFSQPH